jgi:hypothetical protein
VDKFEYLSGLPEVGIVPRAPHAGPLLREVYEQEHGRGGFAGVYTTEPRFTFRENRLAEVRAAAERLASERDTLRPTGGDDDPGQ